MRPREVAVAVLAKQPRPGFSKTRLHPPFTLEEAAELAEAMLRDVLEAVAATSTDRRIVVLEGETGAWLPPGFEVIAQRGANHAERIAAAFEDVAGPVLLIGMDTPQVTPAQLEDAARRLTEPGVDAVLGPAADGGWWLGGVRSPHPAAFRRVPTSRPDTLRLLRASLAEQGLRWVEVAELADVDDHNSALEVAAGIPHSHFARLMARLGGRPAAVGE